jgi:hypothetical protein
MAAANGYTFALTRDRLTLQRDGAKAEGPFPLDLAAFDLHAGVRQVASLLVALGDSTLAAQIDVAAPFYSGIGSSRSE